MPSYSETITRPAEIADTILKNELIADKTAINLSNMLQEISELKTAIPSDDRLTEDMKTAFISDIDDFISRVKVEVQAKLQEITDIFGV